MPDDDDECVAHHGVIMLTPSIISRRQVARERVEEEVTYIIITGQYATHANGCCQRISTHNCLTLVYQQACSACRHKGVGWRHPEGSWRLVARQATSCCSHTFHTPHLLSHVGARHVTCCLLDLLSSDLLSCSPLVSKLLELK